MTVDVQKRDSFAKAKFIQEKLDGLKMDHT